MKRQFALAPHKYGYYDPVSNIHLTVDKPVSPIIDDEFVDVRNLERAVRVGSLIDLTPKPDKTAKKEAATKTVAKAKTDEKAEKQDAEDTSNAETALDAGEAAEEAGEGVTEKAEAKTATKKRATKEK